MVWECVCVCVRNNLKYALHWHINKSVYSILSQYHKHTHILPRTIWGQWTNRAKSGYCLSYKHNSKDLSHLQQLSPGMCVNTRYVINNSAYLCASVILFLLNVSINNCAYLCVSVVLFLLDVSINNSAYLCVLFLLLLDVSISNRAYLPMSVIVILIGASLDNMWVLLFCWLSV